MHTHIKYVGLKKRSKLVLGRLCFNAASIEENVQSCNSILDFGKQFCKRTHG